MATRSYLWQTGIKYTLYVQVDGVDDQVVFKWSGTETPIARLRSTYQELDDCQLVSFDSTGCQVMLGNESYSFIWAESTQERPGLIAEGIIKQNGTSWGQLRKL